MTLPYELGLHQLTERTYAWMQPRGSWGYSNAGLVVGEGESLLVDTLFDLQHTQQMLDAMEPLLQDAPLKYVINTHGDGDHYFGNQLLPEDVEVMASEQATTTMTQAHVAAIDSMLENQGPGGEYSREAFAAFDFSGLEIREPTSTISQDTHLNVGGVDIEIVVSPPAHTFGDVFIHVPEYGTLFAGDLLFIGVAPIAWAGPLESWEAACDLILAKRASTIVPGHGPVTDEAGVKEVQRYLRHVREHSKRCIKAGKDFFEAVRTVDMSEFSELQASGRVVQNIRNVYQHRGIEIPPVGVMDMIAEWEAGEQR